MSNGALPLKFLKIENGCGCFWKEVVGTCLQVDAID